jgi:hypothetical protein
VREMSDAAVEFRSGSSRAGKSECCANGFTGGGGSGGA